MKKSALHFLLTLTGALLLSASAAQNDAADEQERYPVVSAGRPFVFPDDNGAHPEYRTEWWYITGWLTDRQHNERGFQVTFFRVRPMLGEHNPSRFAPTQLIFAHAAIADPAEGRLLHADRVERALEPLTGARSGQTQAWIGDWTLAQHPGGDPSANDGAETYRASITAEEFAFDLRFTTDGAPLLNGDGGYSRKTPDPLNASYYYSRPHLRVDGRLAIRGETHDVRGSAWLDHEWSSEILPDDASGWDWTGINLNDGGSLMAFQMRDRQGRAIWHAATYRPGGAPARILEPAQIRFTPLRHWRSPRTGTRYPVEWRLDIGGRQWTLSPLFDDQELDSRASTGAVYWEGAVRLKEGDSEIGRGYLEMTGYLDRLKM